MPESGVELDRDAQQAATLRRYRLFATALLAACVAVFAATQAIPAPNFWTKLLGAGAEAAIVGGLADWFAVTALFRRPLGLPIPHTAIVPRQKDRVGTWLGTFVVDNFLASHALAKELKSLDLVGQAAKWLAERRNAERVADRLLDMLPHVVSALDDQDMRRLVRRGLGRRLAAVDLAGVLGTVLKALVAKGHHKALLARALPVVQGFIASNEQSFYGAVERRLWFLPRRLDGYLARQLVAVIQEALADLAAPDAPNAARLEQALSRLADDLENDAQVRARVQAAIRQTLALPEVQDWLSTLWDDMRSAILDEATAPASRLRRAVTDGFAAAGDALGADPALAAKLTAIIDRAVSAENASWRARVANFIASEVRGWNTAEFTRRMELWAGRELQYIRINGTVLGFLIGVGLFLASTALGHS